MRDQFYIQILTYRLGTQRDLCILLLIWQMLLMGGSFMRSRWMFGLMRIQEDEDRWIDLREFGKKGFWGCGWVRIVAVYAYWGLLWDCVMGGWKIELKHRRFGNCEIRDKNFEVRICLRKIRSDSAASAHRLSVDSLEFQNIQFYGHFSIRIFFVVYFTMFPFFYRFFLAQVSVFRF